LPPKKKTPAKRQVPSKVPPPRPASNVTENLAGWTQEGAGKPTPEEMAAVARVAPLANLQQVQLMSISATRVGTPEKGVPLRGSITTTGRGEVEGTKLTASLKFEYRSEPATLSVVVSFAVTYLLTGTVSADDARAFAKVNAMFNTWPYVREILQNTAVRMGAPVPQVPLLKIR
jgi:uncharacterized membrane protein